VIDDPDDLPVAAPEYNISILGGLGYAGQVPG